MSNYLIINQLNPHFINNTLTWFQSRFYTSGDREGFNTISKFSKNIDTIFRNSKNGNSFHSLAEEMKVINNYLHIQTKRFGESLKYSLPNDEIINQFADINVFLMQIQIHCENAVEHGIRHSVKTDGGGLLTVRIIDKDQDYLHIIIEDDGVGRAEAKKNKSNSTQHGTTMLKQLQDIFNSNNDLKMNSEYEDLPFERSDGTKCGTRVILTIPKRYNYAIKFDDFNLNQ